MRGAAGCATAGRGGGDPSQVPSPIPRTASFTYARYHKSTKLGGAAREKCSLGNLHMLLAWVVTGGTALR